MTTPKRTIRKHKGGRTKRLPSGRVTEAELRAVMTALAESGLTFSDWVVSKLETKQ